MAAKLTVSGAVQAVVVHHRNFPGVLETVDDLRRAGITSDALLVVDNSDDDLVASKLADALADSARLLVTKNRGYGAAVNEGLSALATTARPLTLVVTHEVRIDPLSVRILAECAQNPHVGVVGPVLVRGGTGQQWSAGGRLSRFLLRPAHIRTKPGTGVAVVDWVDGAVGMYRTDVLVREPFREDFFLYYEETELHTRLRRNGFEVLVALGARASQESGGMPAEARFRGAMIFQSIHGSWCSRRLSVPVQFATQALWSLLAGRPQDIRGAARGVRQGYSILSATRRKSDG